MPADLGYPNDGFILPELIVNEHTVYAQTPPPGMLFVVPAFGLQEEREERRRTLRERVDTVQKLVNHDGPAVIWCHLNSEGDALSKALDTIQVKGGDSDEKKEEAYKNFGEGKIRTIVIKPKIGAWGLNWQHCNHVVTFASHSYEQYYQSVRRCWRFGQKKSVRVDIISTDGEQHVRDNMTRKMNAADVMFQNLVSQMNNPLWFKKESHDERMELPTWL